MCELTQMPTSPLKVRGALVAGYIITNIYPEPLLGGGPNDPSPLLSLSLWESFLKKSQSKCKPNLQTAKSGPFALLACGLVPFRQVAAGELESWPG